MWRSCAVVVAVLAAVVGFAGRQLIRNPIDFQKVNLAGKHVVVTGATLGIGFETAVALAEWGATLHLPVRSQAKAEALTKQLKSRAPEAKVHVYADFDLADLMSVRKFAKDLRTPVLDVLINNAGVMPVGNVKLDPTVDGMEHAYQVNHLGPFLLSRMLVPALEKARSGARVVFVSSAAHYMGSVDKNIYNTTSKGLKPDTWTSERYGTTKLMNCITAVAYDEHYKAKNIRANCLNPGFVQSDLDSSLPPGVREFSRWFRGLVARETREGAVCSVTVATAPGLNGVGGRYFEDRCADTLCDARKPWHTLLSCFMCDAENPPGVVANSQVRDKALQKWLWVTSSELVGL